MKFYEIPNLINNLFFDGDIVDYRLDFEEHFAWGTETRNEYDLVINAIDSYESFGQGYEIYMWCDFSGYDYWMTQQQEQNYIQITVSFDGEDFDENYLGKLKFDLEMAKKFAENLANKNNYSP